MFRPPVALLALVGINGSLNAGQKHDISNAAIQAAPGAVVTAGTRFMGLAPSDMLAVLSATFIVLQIAYLIWKWRRDARHEDEREDDRRRGLRGPEPQADTEEA